MKRDRRSKSSGGDLAMVGVVGLGLVCCAGALILGTLGVGAVLAAVTSWWVLLPAGLVAAGIAAWYAWRRSCRIRDERAHETTQERTRQ